MVTRRAFLGGGLGWALVPGGPVAVRPAHAQRPKLLRIGGLSEAWGPTPSMVGLREGLIELGYREHEDFAIGVRFTQGDLAALPAAARGLIEQGADVLVSGGGAAARAAIEATATRRVPVVFIAGDPFHAGLLSSYTRPGANVTGVTTLDLELAPKRLEVFREIVPALKQVLVVYPAVDSYATLEVEGYRTAAARLGLVLVERPARTRDEVTGTAARVRREDAQGILVPMFSALNIPAVMIDTSVRLGLPTMFQDRYWVEQGGLASYGADHQGSGRLAARLVDKIARGARPGDIPVERYSRIEFTLNLKVARRLGLPIPPEVLVRVDRVVE
jgi:putative ABC transport system substrate-binding protein